MGRNELGSPELGGARVAGWCSTMCAQESPLQSLEKAWCPGQPLNHLRISRAGSWPWDFPKLPGRFRSTTRRRLHQEGGPAGPWGNTSPVASGRDPEPSGSVPRAGVSPRPSDAGAGGSRLSRAPVCRLFGLSVTLLGCERLARELGQEARGASRQCLGPV